MIKTAVMGYGTIGSGVTEILAENRDVIAAQAGQEIELKYVLDLREFPDSPIADKVIHEFKLIEEDPEIQIVVETMGGLNPAYPFVKACLMAGKHVVTSNKALVAAHGTELLAIARKKKVNFFFEASVGGGIPVLHPLTQCMAANRIDEVYGILNGTTNYILTRMVRAGTTFADALKEAQEKGYAEADPTADVEGVDAGRKICILADLAFGCQVDPADVPMEGISRLSLRDVKIAQRAGYRVKLLGRAVRLPGGRTAYVAPHLIPEEQPLASVDDVFNAVVVRGNATGEVMFYGQGAGELPTASACVADVMEALQSSPRREEIGWEADPAGFEDPQALRSRYYFRIGGSLSAAAAAFGQVEILSEDGGETAFLTDCISGAEAGKQAEGLRVLACLRVLG